MLAVGMFLWAQAAYLAALWATGTQPSNRMSQTRNSAEGAPNSGSPSDLSRVEGVNKSDVAALTRAKVKPAVIAKIVASEPEYKVATGKVSQIWKEEVDRFEITIDGWASHESSLSGQYLFRFRSSEAEVPYQSRPFARTHASLS